MSILYSNLQIPDDISCTHCDQSFSTRKGLMKHTADVHSDDSSVKDDDEPSAKRKRFQCGHCNKIFRKEITLNLHLRDDHNLDEEQDGTQTNSSDNEEVINEESHIDEKVMDQILAEEDSSTSIQDCIDDNEDLDKEDHIVDVEPNEAVEDPNVDEEPNEADEDPDVDEESNEVPNLGEEPNEDPIINEKPTINEEPSEEETTVNEEPSEEEPTVEAPPQKGLSEYPVPGELEEETLGDDPAPEEAPVEIEPNYDVVPLQEEPSQEDIPDEEDSSVVEESTATEISLHDSRVAVVSADSESLDEINDSKNKSEERVEGSADNMETDDYSDLMDEAIKLRGEIQKDFQSNLVEVDENISDTDDNGTVESSNSNDMDVNEDGAEANSEEPDTSLDEDKSTAPLTDIAEDLNNIETTEITEDLINIEMTSESNEDGKEKGGVEKDGEVDFDPSAFLSFAMNISSSGPSVETEEGTQPLIVSDFIFDQLMADNGEEDSEISTMDGESFDPTGEDGSTEESMDTEEGDNLSSDNQGESETVTNLSKRRKRFRPTYKPPAPEKKTKEDTNMVDGEYTVTEVSDSNITSGEVRSDLDMLEFTKYVDPDGKEIALSKQDVCKMSPYFKNRKNSIRSCTSGREQFDKVLDDLPEGFRVSEIVRDEDRIDRYFLSPDGRFILNSKVACREYMKLIETKQKGESLLAPASKIAKKPTCPHCKQTFKKEKTLLLHISEEHPKAKLVTKTNISTSQSETNLKKQNINNKSSPKVVVDVESDESKSEKSTNNISDFKKDLKDKLKSVDDDDISVIQSLPKSTKFTFIPANKEEKTPAKMIVQKYSCSICKKIYLTRPGFDQHVKKDHAPPGTKITFNPIDETTAKKLICSYCKGVFFSRPDFMKHVEKEHSGPKKADDKVANSTTETTSDKENSTPKTPKQQLVCSYCRKLFSTRADFMQHVNEDHSKGHQSKKTEVKNQPSIKTETTSQPIVKTVTKSQQTPKTEVRQKSGLIIRPAKEVKVEKSPEPTVAKIVKVHETKVVNIVRTPPPRIVKAPEPKVRATFRCEWCPRVFKEEEMLVSHKKAMHEIKCPKCETKTFCTKQELIDHQQTTHIYKCKICPKTFNDEKVLEGHKQMVHTFKCPKCETKTFGTKQELMDHHQSTHTYRCKLCPKTFNDEKVLEGHKQMVHTFKCQKCVNVVFNTRNELESHHKNTHQFRCDECTSVLNSKELLAEHKEREHKKGCEDCEDEFSWVDMSTHSCYYTKNKVRPENGRVVEQNLYTGYYF